MTANSSSSPHGPQASDPTPHGPQASDPTPHAPQAPGAGPARPPEDSGGLLPTGPTLTLLSRRGPRHAVVSVDGPIDYHTTPQLLGHLTTPEMRDVPLLVLDLSEVDFCDSSALGAFVDLYRRRHADGRRFGLTGLQPQVRRILELTRLTTVVPLYATLEQALPGV
ncbi:STAS domain-containing protein [Streptomyces sp. LP11]|uniref:Anti-sigma factor antagonist n=1 Tax=Streptomyces pyxinicus TaxID=2970331 RepID=A0ABT2B773_9ACTN|nr:STAS domain-containing protein [Streptomyces sp. LP11]MCS0604356.1 STAS domain-containing protein [Streptomyces sp. LP11]